MKKVGRAGGPLASGACASDGEGRHGLPYALPHLLADAGEFAAGPTSVRTGGTSEAACA